MMPNEKPLSAEWAVCGPGMSGTTTEILEANTWMKNNPDAHLYVSAEFHEATIRAHDERIRTQKNWLDDIATALHPGKPLDGWTYLPQQLAGMVTRLQERIKELESPQTGKLWKSSLIEHDGKTALERKCDQLKERIKELERELANARADTERLAFVIRYRHDIGWWMDPNGLFHIIVDEKRFIRKTWREAIDAARLAQKPEKPNV